MEQKIARGNQFHIAYQPESRLYLRLGHNDGFVFTGAQAREFYEALKGVME